MRRIRVLIAKPGLDGHDRGARFVARSLADAGMEVVYTGIRQLPGDIAAAAVQEDVDVVGLSILSGAHLELLPQVVEELRNRGKGDALLLVGGTVPPQDVPVLEEMGVAKVFGPGTPMEPIIAFIREEAAGRHDD